MWNRFGIFSALLYFLFLPIAQAESGSSVVYEENGNIFLKENRKTHQLTQTGKDSEPILSPNGKWVAYNREIREKTEKCSKWEDPFPCPSDELWIFNLETRSQHLLLEPREHTPELKAQEVLYQFNGKEFSPSSKTIYFTTPAWVVSDAIHAVDSDGKNERYIMHGYAFQVVRKPLSNKIKKYLLNDLKEDDWRIYPKKKGYDLVFKALKGDVLGYLIIERSGVETVSTPTLEDSGWKGEDGKYYKSLGRSLWKALVSPDGEMNIPLGKEY